MGLITGVKRCLDWSATINFTKSLQLDRFDYTQESNAEKTDWEKRSSCKVRDWKIQKLLVKL